MDNIFLNKPELISLCTLKVLITIIQLNFIQSYLPNPSARAGYDTRSIFKRSLTGLN